MRYMLLICNDQSAEAGPEEGLGAETDAWVEEVDGRGVRKSGDRLRPANEATTVRVRAGEVLLSDGPFADTKDLIAGYDVVECADLDEAVEVASKHPMARYGAIEVRPFWGA
jgi:hypothetical protein